MIYNSKKNNTDNDNNNYKIIKIKVIIMIKN